MNRKLALCTLCLSICFTLSLPILASWTDEVVEELEAGVGGLDTTVDKGEFSPYLLLPLSAGNQWQFLYKDILPGTEPDAEISMSLGETERLGDFCLSPLVFGDRQLELFISNNNERLVFYGFRGQISGVDTAFFFRNGTESSIDSGIDLASIDEDQDLLLEQSGTQPAELNGQPIQLTWIARNKVVQTVTLDDNPSFDGEVAGENTSKTPESAYQFKFDLFFKPCENETGCFAGRFTLEFVPELGLTGVRLVGDSPSLGGQYDYSYTLLEAAAPGNSFILDEEVNQLSFFSCNSLFAEDNLSRAATGGVYFWFTIALLIVVVLRQLQDRNYRPHALRVGHHNDKNY